MRLLVINPNTTASVTDLVAGHVRRAAGPGVTVIPATGRFGCAYIATEACYAVAAHAALECYNEHGTSCDAVLLACFGDPGIFALRKVSAIPVTGLAEACMQTSAARVGRFSIVTGGAAWQPMLERFASQIGLRQSLASVRTVSLSGGQIAKDPDAALEMLAVACRAAEADGAEEIILGGAGLAGLAERIGDRCEVPVLDSVLLGTQTALRRQTER